MARRVGRPGHAPGKRSTPRLSDAPRTGFLKKVLQEQQEATKNEVKWDEIRANLRALLFQQQRDFIDDPSRFKSALTPRRSGKTTCAAVYCFDVCIAKPGARVVFIGVTRGAAKKNIWSHFVKLNKDFSIKAKLNSVTNWVTFSNGSKLEIAGVDNRAELEKLRGQFYDLVIIDEAKSYPIDLLKELIEDIISPTLADHKGTLCLMGTPGTILDGPFYKATHQNSFVKRRMFSERFERDIEFVHTRPYPRRAEPQFKDIDDYQWSFHYWTSKDNTALPHLWEEALRNKEMNGWSDQSSVWVREWLGQWMPDTGLQVYRYDQSATSVNAWEPPADFKEQPEGALAILHPKAKWQYILGIDLGYTADTAFTVMAYSEHVKCLYHVFSYAEDKMIVEDVAAFYRKLVQRFGNFAAVVIDSGGGGKQVAESLKQTYGIPAQSAQKTDKRDYIELFNSDMQSGLVKILRGSDLATEMIYLQWADKTQAKENKENPNHLCDSALYAWRYSYHHFAQDFAYEPPPGSEEWWAKKEREMIEREEREARASDSSEGMDRWGFGDTTLDRHDPFTIKRWARKERT